MKLHRLFFALAALLCTGFSFSQTARKPNVILIITDDQGYGDFGFTGNPHVKTPVLDKFAEESIRFNDFYVSPVCAPTRSSLMTGRYSLRTGIRDTYNGGAIMAPEEVTVAEMLKNNGYRTGIFGKWHLGDNFPSRPMDQGFDESVIHLSGGMGQVGDITTWFKGDSSYFDPVLWHNGKPQAYEGYCTDVFTREAIRFIDAGKDQPFFCYLAYNAPHTPLQVPDEYYQMYKDLDPSTGFDGDVRPFPNMSVRDKEDARRVYAMVSNIDDNIGRLLNHLGQKGIARETIIIFLTDNGPQQQRYLAGMKGLKGSVYRGGVRVPLWIKHPSVEGNKDIPATAAHIDLLPTIAELTKTDLPLHNSLDGRSLVPLMTQDNALWPERPLFFYWARRYPELYNNMAIHKGNYKLVGHTSFDASVNDFQLFDIHNDPYEQKNIISDHLSLAEELKKEMDQLYFELIHSENIKNPPLIEVGNENENPIILNRNDAGGDRGIWDQDDVYGKWDVKINEGIYNLEFKFTEPVAGGGYLLLETGGIIHRKNYNGDECDVIRMDHVYLPAMKRSEIIPFYFQKEKRIFPFWVRMEKI